MTVIFILLCVGWLISLGMWFYTMLNKKRRENGDYYYPFVALSGFNIAISILSLFT